MPKVNLSPFICRELVYDYLLGSLSPERRIKFQEFLATDEELRKGVELYKHSLQYMGELKKVEPSEEYLRVFSEYLEEPLLEDGFQTPSKQEVVAKNKRSMGAIKDHIKPLPDFFSRPSTKFYLRRLTEAVSLALVVFIVVKIIPNQYYEKSFWESKRGVILSEESFNRNLEDASLEGVAIGENEVVLDEEAEGIREEEPSVKMNEPAPKIGKDPNLKVVVNPADHEAPSEEEEVAEETTTSETNPGDKQKFYLFRSVIYVDDMPSVSQAFSAFLAEHGARKAGNVKLGWEKPNARYFHFHIDEKHKEGMLQFLTPYGKLKLDKIEHWRKVPDDKMRVIIEIRQKGQ